MGLHRDGSLYGFSADETADRRLLWLQLCVLDMRVCESYGPRPGIRLGDFDVSISLITEPEDKASCEPGIPSQHDCATFNTLRFEYNQMRRLLWNDMCRLEAGKISLTTSLKKIDNFSRAMSVKYDNILIGDSVFASYSKKFLSFLIENLYVMILYPYYTRFQNLCKA